MTPARPSPTYQTRPYPRQPQPRQRGITLTGTLITLASIVGISATTYFATPYVLKADSTSNNTNSENRSNWPDEARAAVDALDTLIRKSKHTLLLKTTNRQPANLEFIVLWLFDDDDPGHINESEIVVLRHSSLLQSITAYAATKPALDAESRRNRQRITFHQISKRGFIDDFLSQSTVESHVIGIRIPHWQIAANGSSDHAAQSVLQPSPGQIELTCLLQSDDTSIIASVPTALRPTYRSQ